MDTTSPADLLNTYHDMRFFIAIGIVGNEPRIAQMIQGHFEELGWKNSIMNRFSIPNK
jgi:hypothetical protein